MIRNHEELSEGGDGAQGGGPPAESLFQEASLARKGYPGCAARPWAVLCNAFGVGLPRVRCATLGCVVQRLRRSDRSDGPGYPGCAARPWAVLCNAFGVAIFSRRGLLE